MKNKYSICRIVENAASIMKLLVITDDYASKGMRQSLPKACVSVILEILSSHLHRKILHICGLNPFWLSSLLPISV